jgi:endonuclease/exonuclease/phosphatase family metal-dependent hydrolase
MPVRFGTMRAGFLAVLVIACGSGDGTDTGPVDAADAILEDAGDDTFADPGLACDAGGDMPGEPRPDAHADTRDRDVQDASDAAGGPQPDADATDLPAEAWEPGRLVVMSFNLRTVFGDDGVNAWGNRKDLAVRIVRDASPDILGTQETMMLHVDVLAEALPGFEHVGRTRTDSIWDEACTIWFRRERFDLVDSGTFWLSETPEVSGSTFTANQLYPRIVTWVRLRDRASDRELAAFNTHWGYEQFDDIQPRSAALTLARMAGIAQGLPAVLSGDFNCGPGQAGWEILVGGQAYQGVAGDLVDPWVELELPAQGTVHGFTGTTAGKRIDNVFHTPDVQATAARIVTDHDDEIYPSDHFPVVVELAGF